MGGDQGASLPVPGRCAARRWPLGADDHPPPAPTAILAQIAEQATVNGKLYDAETWHELFKRKFIGVIELPDGSVIGKSSTKLTTAEFSEFCGLVEAYAAAELGVTFYDLEVA